MVWRCLAYVFLPRLRSQGILGRFGLWKASFVLPFHLAMKKGASCLFLMNSGCISVTDHWCNGMIPQAFNELNPYWA